MVVQGHITHERVLTIFTTGEPMGFEHIGNAPIEALDHAVGAERAWLGQAMFNVQCSRPGTVDQTHGCPWPGAHGGQTTCR